MQVRRSYAREISFSAVLVRSTPRMTRDERSVFVWLARPNLIRHYLTHATALPSLHDTCIRAHVSLPAYLKPPEPHLHNNPQSFPIHLVHLLVHLAHEGELFGDGVRLLDEAVKHHGEFHGGFG